MGSKGWEGCEPLPELPRERLQNQYTGYDNQYECHKGRRFSTASGTTRLFETTSWNYVHCKGPSCVSRERGQGNRVLHEDPKYAGTKEKCQRLCSMNASCHSFEWSEAHSECHLSSLQMVIATGMELCFKWENGNPIEKDELSVHPIMADGSSP